MTDDLPDTPDDVVSQSDSERNTPLQSDVDAMAETAFYEPGPNDADQLRAANSALPERIAHYRIERLLGQGGMGVVYQAYDERLKRSVALKLLLGGSHHGQQVERFRAEAEAVARLEHPGIIRLYEVGVEDSQPYIALEFVEGGTLTDWIANEPQDPEASARLFAAMARAVAYAHQQDVIHRDLKPANVLLDRRGSSDSDIMLAGSSSSGRRSATAANAGSTVHPSRKPSGSSSQSRSQTSEILGSDSQSSGLTPKISDFGLARMLNEDSSNLTQTGAVLGTPAYMHPEQASGQARDVGKAADIYSLGAKFYVMLTGRPPFVAQSPIAVLQLVQNEPPASPRLLQPGIPRDLETICLKCLEKEPERRYASADDLARDVDNFLATVRSRLGPSTLLVVQHCSTAETGRSAEQ